MKKVKNIIDFIISLFLLIILFPLFILIMFLIYLNMGRPIFFKQKRAGFKGKPFYIFKFRTMKNIYDSNGNLLHDEERLTKLGKFLRSSSLDELPELINVLKGEMSIVGPRPLLYEYLPLYTPEQARRHEVKPGMTGWVQVNGRNALSWEEKFKLDVWYVDNWSLLLDMKIIWRTIKQVLKREGIQHHNHVTMPKFRGTVNE